MAWLGQATKAEQLELETAAQPFLLIHMHTYLLWRWLLLLLHQLTVFDLYVFFFMFFLLLSLLFFHELPMESGRLLKVLPVLRCHFEFVQYHKIVSKTLEQAVFSKNIWEKDKFSQKTLKTCSNHTAVVHSFGGCTKTLVLLGMHALDFAPVPLQLLGHLNSHHPDGMHLQYLKSVLQPGGFVDQNPSSLQSMIIRMCDRIPSFLQPIYTMPPDLTVSCRESEETKLATRPEFARTVMRVVQMLDWQRSPRLVRAGQNKTFFFFTQSLK